MNWPFEIVCTNLERGRKHTAWTKGVGITWNDGMKWISEMMAARSGHDLQICGLFNPNACGFLQR